MIDELRKRPFARPLFVWITGICLYVFLPHEWILAFLLTGLLLILVSSREETVPRYGDRWHWGVVFYILLLALSVAFSFWRDSLVEDRQLFPPVVNYAAGIKSQLLSRLERLQLADARRDILGAMLLGDANMLDRETRMQFSVTGVAHILSVSGFHVAVVCAFISFALKPLPDSGLFRWVKYCLIMLLLWCFTLVSGMSPPAVRSAFMLSLFLTGRTIRLATDGYNTLAASAFLMLAYNPFYLFDIGFQLSYLAVWFILLLQKPLEQLLEIRNPLFAEPYSWITMSVAAQAGTSFLCLYYFSQFPALFLLTNLPFSLVSLLLIPAGLIYMLLPAGFPGSAMLGQAIESMTGFLMYIVESFSAFPWAAFIIPLDFIDMALGYAFLFMLVFFVHRKKPVYLLSSAAFLLVLLLKLLVE